MKTNNLLNLCDAVIEAARTLRRELVPNDTIREHLCGTWTQDDSRVSFCIRKDGGRYTVEERFSNDVNGRMKVFEGELLEDGDGKLYISNIDRVIGYDGENDRLLAETFGAFERQKHVPHAK